MPRIRNWKGKDFYRPSPETRFEHIDSLFTAQADWDLIETMRPELLRVAVSIKAGAILPPKSRVHRSGVVNTGSESLNHTGNARLLHTKVAPWVAARFRGSIRQTGEWRWLSVGQMKSLTLAERESGVRRGFSHWLARRSAGDKCAPLTLLSFIFEELGRECDGTLCSRYCSLSPF